MGDAGSKAAEHDADIGGPAGSENISAPVFSGDQSERPMPCVCSIESGPCERVESLQMSGRF